MKCRLTDEELLQLVRHQTEILGGGLCLTEKEYEQFQAALKRTERCFQMIRSPYFWDGGEIVFKVEHTVQYMIFLYYFSNELYKAGKEEKASDLYRLNKLLNNVELFYAIELPEHFCAEHPLGTVLGKAKYGDRFFFYQGVTVGGNRKNGKLYYPVIGDHVTMYSNSKVLGDSHIGDHVIIAANAYVKDAHIPGYSAVFGQYPNLVVKDLCKETEHNIWKT